MAKPGSRGQAQRASNRSGSYWYPAAVAVAAVAPYAASLDVPFVFDDLHRIVESTTIRRLWPPGGWIRTNRPLTEFTFALNFAFGGLSVWSYHAVNLALHVGVALLLAQMARVILEAAGGKWKERAASVGWWAALVFAVHPLQTQAVTYIAIRGELLMAACYLATVSFSLRGFAAAGIRRRLLFLGATLSCALGMASKEAMVTAPFMVAWVDLCVVSKSWRDWLRGLDTRWPLYAGLAATWSLLLVLFSVASYKGVGADTGIAPLRYLATEWGVILHYLRLFVFPSGLVLDYGWPVAERWLAAGVLLPMAGVLAIAGLALVLFREGKGVWAVWIGWSLGILVPTSTAYPIADPAFEHRMYLPVAGLAMLVAMAAEESLRRRRAGLGRHLAAAAGAGTIVLLAAATFARTQVWQDPIRLWQDTASKRPQNARAHYTLGTLLSEAGQSEAAARALRRAVEIQPNYANARTNLGNVLTRLGRLDEAAEQYRAALQLRPESAPDHSNLANILLDQSQVAQAREHLERALSLDPQFADAHNNLGVLLGNEGELAQAAAHFRAALAARPDFAAARMNLATVLSRAGRTDEAVAEYRQLLNTDSGNPQLYYFLALALGQAGRTAAAVEVLRAGMRASGGSTELSAYLAWLLATSPDASVRDGEEAVRLAQSVVDSTAGGDPGSLDTLAAAYAERGRFEDAVSAASKALELARKQDRHDLARPIEERISLYRAHRPYRER